MSSGLPVFRSSVLHFLISISALQSTMLNSHCSYLVNHCFIYNFRSLVFKLTSKKHQQKQHIFAHLPTGTSTYTACTCNFSYANYLITNTKELTPYIGLLDLQRTETVPDCFRFFLQLLESPYED